MTAADEFVELKSRVAGLSERYQQLKSSSDDVQSRLRRAHDARHELHSVAEMLTTWMNEAHVDDTPVSGLDAAELQQQLTQTRVITAELSVQVASNKHTHTHTHTQFSWTNQVSRYQKGKTDLDFTEARDSEWQWHQLGHMQVCTSQIATPAPHHSVFYMPFLSPNQQCQSTEGK